MRSLLLTSATTSAITPATISGLLPLNMLTLTSIGPDASPIVLPLQEAGMENHRTLPYLPQDPPLRSATKARMVVSWWDREVHVWRLRKQLKDLVDVSDGESAVTKNRKLLARILIKGEANITSAAISDDGSFLVVSTTTDIKAFHLKPRSDARKDELKISKIEIPEGVAMLGATSIQIAPDEQWLCLIQESSNVCVLRVIHDSNSESKPTIHPKTIRLQRIGRKIPKHIALGGLGQYERTITHIAFSPDSKMLAVADLAGYIDTWVLRQPVPKLQNGVNGTHHDDSASDANMSDDDDDDENENDVDNTGDSVRWTRNPSATLIPKLHAAPTVLSFSSHIPKTTATTTTPRPEDDDDNQESPADDDYVLLAITAKPQVLLLNPSLGSLTAWSRRNPVSRFPVEFRNIRELVKGALWSGDRVWLYGSNFLAMLNLTRDMTATTEATADGSESNNPSATALVTTTTNGQQQHQGRKRKRGPDTGAGNKMDVGALGPTKVVRHVRGQKTEELSLDSRSRRPFTPDPMDTDVTSGPGEEEEDEDDSESEDEERRGELALLRGQQQKGGDSDGNNSGGGGGKSTGGGLTFWCTYKYRPILGVVPLAGGGGDDGDDDDEGEGEEEEEEEEKEATTAAAEDEDALTRVNGQKRMNGTVKGMGKKKMLEVALVERPMWEVDMPDRYFADGEYDR